MGGAAKTIAGGKGMSTCTLTPAIAETGAKITNVKNDIFKNNFFIRLPPFVISVILYRIKYLIATYMPSGKIYLKWQFNQVINGYYRLKMPAFLQTANGEKLSTLENYYFFL